MAYTPKILIVDDEPRMCDSLRVLLSGNGYQIDTVESGKKAIEYLAKKEYDLLLLDIIMPEMDGHQVMDYIADHWPDTLVILITGHASIESAVEALRKGAYDYLRKPFEHEELLSRVKNALEHRRLKKDREQAVEELTKVAALRQILLDSLPPVAMLLRPHTQEIVAANRAGEKVGAVPGKKCYETWGRSDSQCPWCLAPVLWSTGEAQHLNSFSDGRYWDMHWIPVSDDMFLHYAYDITEYKQIEDALRESEEKYRHLVNYAPTGIYEIDLLETKIVSVNDVMCEYTGYTREEFLELNPLDLLVDDSKKQFIEKQQKMLDGEHVPNTVECKIRGKNGRELWVFFNSRFTYKDRMPVRATVVAHDITKRKLIEEEKERLEAQLQQTQKMKALGTLAGGIAHNFNNLLMGIQGNTSIILFDIDSSNPHYTYLKCIEKQVQSGTKLTKQLLGYARKGKYYVQSINMNKLVKETVDTFGPTRKDIVIHQELDENLYGIKADQGQIEQVLLNLYVNSAYAMPGGGDFLLKTMNVTDKDVLGKPFKLKPGNYILLIVRDTGVGMDKKTMERIFDPFFTTKEIAEGTGLGLAFVYGTIKGHDGYIDVDSKTGHGTTFSIYLPATEEKVK